MENIRSNFYKGIDDDTVSSIESFLTNYIDSDEKKAKIIEFINLAYSQGIDHGIFIGESEDVTADLSIEDLHKKFMDDFHKKLLDGQEPPILE